jgi:hypothetical protein
MNITFTGENEIKHIPEEGKRRNMILRIRVRKKSALHEYGTNNTIVYKRYRLPAETSKNT